MSNLFDFDIVPENRKKSSLKTKLIESVENISKDKDCVWKNSVFYPLIHLSNDERGKWGESFLNDVLSEITDNAIWLKDKNIKQNDGIYDIKILNKRIEVKTALRGTKNYSWQHENIYNERVWDYLMLVDVDVEGIYFTSMQYEDFIFGKKHEIFNKTPTLRKGQTDKYKFDLSINNIHSGINSGLTFYYDVMKDNSKALKSFMKEKLL